MSPPRTTTVQQVIRSEKLVAIFDVPATIVDELPDEPLFDAQTMKLLDEAMHRVDDDDRAWLREHGAKLFVSLDDAGALPNRVA